MKMPSVRKQTSLTNTQLSFHGVAAVSGKRYYESFACTVSATPAPDAYGDQQAQLSTHAYKIIRRR
jgi:hypothetical protein